MARSERLSLINAIENERSSKVICYITGDRENVNTRIAPDVTTILYRHLEMLKNQPKIDLFLYTRGGDVLTPWRLVNLVREYTDFFSVIVPFRSYSAGTLICLGADEIIMGKMGELGPIDPSVVNAFNPQDPANPQARVPVSIEDVYSYLALAREKAGNHKDELMDKSFLLLAEKIHPLAIGNVHRNYMLIRSLATKLLRLQLNPPSDDKIISIVDNLTEKLYAHNHMISRREADKEIQLPIIYPDQYLEDLIWKLYINYAHEMSLNEPFNPADMLNGPRMEFEVVSGTVESSMGQDVFVFSGVVERKDFPEKGQVDVNIVKQGWRTLS